MPLRRFACLALLSVFWCTASGATEGDGDRSDAKESVEGAVATSFLAPLVAGERLDLPPLDPRTPRPDQSLGSPLGAKFNHWERILDYLTVLDAASDRVVLSDYGRTVEGRRLVLLAISTPANLARLDEIRRDRLRLAEPGRLTAAERERLLAHLPTVVWLGYGVHGNESSSAEAAMGAAYVFAAGQGDFARLFEHTIVVLDPLMNPDGRERYLASYEQQRGAEPNPRREAAEHAEPWPSGRVNHYLIDLNRDWAWATQTETRARLVAYRAWEPQVFVDFHEMSAESTYFFPPPADPVHTRISRRTLGWLETFGRANAVAFDRLGWVYFKQENYDLLYPGYGDSYPSLRGAVGMTYEMAGGGRAGELLTRLDGTRLSLVDRVAHHLATSIATLRTAAAGSRRLLEDFVANRLDASSGPGHVYTWTPDGPDARALADLLALHGVRVEQLSASTELKVRPSGGGEEVLRRFPAGTFVVSSGQSLGPLVEALMERRAQIGERFADRQKERQARNLESEFYDITAWSLPLAFNQEVWLATPGAPALLAGQPLAPAPSGLSGSGNLGVLVKPQGLMSYRLAVRLRAAGIAFRVALRDFQVDGLDFSPGTLFVSRYGNPSDLEARLSADLEALGLVGRRIESSFDIKGLSLGSSDMPSIRSVRVGLIGGRGVDSTSFGALWFLFDRSIEAPIDRLDLDRLAELDISTYDTLILPDGDFDDRISDKLKERLDAWVKSGGVLVGVAGAISWLQDAGFTEVKSWKATHGDPEYPGDSANAIPTASTGTLEGAGTDATQGGPSSPSPPAEPADADATSADRAISTPGAAFATRMAVGHPLAIGIPTAPPVLIDGDLVLQPTGDPQQDVLTVAPEAPLLSGFAFPEAEQRLSGSLLVSAEKHGRGSVVLFAQEPSYRLFWRGTMPLLLNAALYGQSLGFGGR